MTQPPPPTTFGRLEVISVEMEIDVFHPWVSAWSFEDWLVSENFDDQRSFV
jgi:hypothetical protein